MQSHSPALTATAHANLRWLWVLAPAIAVLAALRYFIALQFLSALLLFAAVFLLFAVVVVGFMLFLDGVDHFYLWSVVRLAACFRASRLAPKHLEVPSQMRQNAPASRPKGRALYVWLFQSSWAPRKSKRTLHRRVGPFKGNRPGKPSSGGAMGVFPNHSD